MLVKVRNDDPSRLSATERTVVNWLKSWSGPHAVPGIAIVQCQDADIVVWTPQTSVVVGVHGFTERVTGTLSCAEDEPWTVDGKPAPIDGDANPLERVLQQTVHLAGQLRSAPGRENVPVSGLVLLCPQLGSRVKLEKGALPPGIDVLIGDGPSSLRNYFTSLAEGAEPSWDAAQVGQALGALGFAAAATYSDLVSEGFPRPIRPGPLPRRCPPPRRSWFLRSPSRRQSRRLPRRLLRARPPARRPDRPQAPQRVRFRAPRLRLSQAFRRDLQALHPAPAPVPAAPSPPAPAAMPHPHNSSHSPQAAARQQAPKSPAPQQQPPPIAQSPAAPPPPNSNTPRAVPPGPRWPPCGPPPPIPTPVPTRRMARRPAVSPPAGRPRPQNGPQANYSAGQSQNPAPGFPLWSDPQRPPKAARPRRRRDLPIVGALVLLVLILAVAAMCTGRTTTTNNKPRPAEETTLTHQSTTPTTTDPTIPQTTIAPACFPLQPGC